MSNPIQRGDTVALVGPRHKPIDGVREFCENLTDAIAPLGVALKVTTVAWDQTGWPRALREIAKRSRLWNGSSVMAQYTHLMWPWRGFPLGFLHLIGILQRGGCRVVVVIHDPSPFPGSRPRDRARRLVQVWVMRQTMRIADAVVTTIAADHIKWMRGSKYQAKVRSIAVGSNIPLSPGRDNKRILSASGSMNVIVFCITADPNIPRAVTLREVDDVCHAVRTAEKSGSTLRLTLVGRGSEEAGPLFRRALGDTSIALSVLGLVSGENLSKVLSHGDVMLFTRGHVSTRRTTAIAGISHGLPLVGYAGEETDRRVLEAGALLVPNGDRQALARTLTRVLADEQLRDQLRRQNCTAYSRYFAWSVIAQQYAEIL